MRYLVFETSARTVSVAVVSLDGVLGELTMNTGHTHSEKLVPVMDTLLAQLELQMDDIQGLVVSSGPGSFTGIRIGMATVMGIAHGAGVPIFPVSSLEGMAWNMAGCGGIVCPIMDARRDQLYSALFNCVEAVPRRVMADTALSVSELIQTLKATDDKVWFVGDGILRFKDLLVEAMGGNAQFPQRHLWHQRAASLGMAALLSQTPPESRSYMNLQPQYLKKTEAERNYDKRHGI